MNTCITQFQNPLKLIQLNLSTTATLEAEESGHCIKRGGHSGEVLIKSQCMDFLSTATKKSNCCREVAVRGGSTDDQALPSYTPHRPISLLLHILHNVKTCN